MNVRLADKEDIPIIINIHKAAFPNHFLTSLGPGFLSIYYNLVLKYPDGIFLVAEDELNKVLGFVCGFSSPEGFYRLLSKQKVAIALSVISSIIVKPITIRDLLIRYMHMQRIEKIDSVGNFTELSSLAVNPLAKRSGIGRILVNEFCNYSRNNNTNFVYLTTDASKNEAVNLFYKQLGFEINRTFERYPKRTMNEYILKLY